MFLFSILPNAIGFSETTLSSVSMIIPFSKSGSPFELKPSWRVSHVKNKLRCSNCNISGTREEALRSSAACACNAFLDSAQSGHPEDGLLINSWLSR